MWKTKEEFDERDWTYYRIGWLLESKIVKGKTYYKVDDETNKRIL